MIRGIHYFSAEVKPKLMSSQGGLYSCYVDYSKAFDTVSRTELWSKLLNNNISGKLFQIIYNMYKSAKSCISVNSTLTDNFSCMIGVRQEIICLHY